MLNGFQDAFSYLNEHNTRSGYNRTILSSQWCAHSRQFRIVILLFAASVNVSIIVNELARKSFEFSVLEFLRIRVFSEASSNFKCKKKFHETLHHSSIRNSFNFMASSSRLFGNHPDFDHQNHLKISSRFNQAIRSPIFGLLQQHLLHLAEVFVFH